MRTVFVCAELPEPLQKQNDAEGKADVESFIQNVSGQVLQDPFADSFGIDEPVVAATDKPATPQITAVLQGIGSGQEDAYAIISGDIYYLGEEKNGIKLLEVHKGWVDVLLNGISSKLQLYPEEDLKKARRGRVKRAAAGASSSNNSGNKF